MDRATNEYEKESVFQRSNAEKQFRMVESALRRIGDGSFAKCQSCGKEIGGARLKAVPPDAVLHPVSRGLRAVSSWPSRQLRAICYLPNFSPSPCCSTVCQ
jgi:hypothetical protein